MKFFTLTFIFFMALSAGACSSSEKGTDDKGGKPGTIQVRDNIPFADPYILYSDGTYYAYGTSSDSGFEFYTSTDLKNWKKSAKWLLLKGDSYGDKWFWAPEVYYNDKTKKYYLFYSAEEHLCVATSDSPAGPFKQDKKEPMRSEKSIDSSLFIDDDGTPYLFFVRFTDGNVIWGAELEPDWMTIREQTLTKCVTAALPWETVQAKVAEGPSVLKKDGKYYMIYSANHYQSQDYAVGYATASSPLGTWTKSSKNPIFHKPSSGLVGTGHGAPFRDKDGNLKYVFHAHSNPGSVQPRKMYITDMSVTSDGVSMDRNAIIFPVELR